MHAARIYPTLIIGMLLSWPCAADLATGKSLHDSVCKTCHQSDYYTRENRIVHSLDWLKKQVDRCQEGAGEEWSATQIDDVAAYLNSSYYKFK